MEFLKSPRRIIHLGNVIVSEDSAPYLIAEIGVNHEGSLDTAKRLIDLAKEGGAQAAKFQSYKAETLASKNSPAYWDTSKEKTQSQFELFKKHDSFGEQEYRILAKHCDTVGIQFLSTPFDLNSVDFLDELMPFFKIASADITNVPLLRKIASKRKPIVLSTGASRGDEIRFAVDYLRDSGATEIALLHCVLNYPTSENDANLGMIKNLMIEFPDIVIGYSDHTVPDESMEVLSSAYLMGATILEKHFTHNKILPGNDHYHAMNCEDIKSFCRRMDRLKVVRGSFVKAPLAGEEPARRHARRSLCSTVAISAGTILTEEHLISKRPAHGVSPKYWDQIIGSRVKHNVVEDHVFKWSDLELKLKNDERIVIGIQARMDSSRFPQKMSKDLAGLPVIDWVLRRCSESKMASEVVLLTSDNKENDFLEERAIKQGLKCYRGSEENVLSRFTALCIEKNVAAVVRVCADNPFISPSEIDRLIKFWLNNPCDYAYNHVSKSPDHLHPDGFGAEVISSSALLEVERMAGISDDYEHVTHFILKNSQSFEICSPEVFSAFRVPIDFKFDIDTPEDMNRLEPIAKKCGVNASAEEIYNFARELYSK